MIKCNLSSRSRTGILYALAHHASNVRPAAMELLAMFYLTDVDGTHEAPRKNARQRTYVEFGGKRYYFRWDGANCIEIRETNYGPVKWRISTRADALHWGRKVGLA